MILGTLSAVLVTIALMVLMPVPDFGLDRFKDCAAPEETVDMDSEIRIKFPKQVNGVDFIKAIAEWPTEDNSTSFSCFLQEPKLAEAGLICAYSIYSENKNSEKVFQYITYFNVCYFAAGSDNLGCNFEFSDFLHDKVEEVDGTLYVNGKVLVLPDSDSIIYFAAPIKRNDSLDFPAPQKNKEDIYEKRFKK